ncbi:TPA: hypothetical protein EYP27_00520 [Candidatus Bathyarchaeota archaeon]|nr:hypothetical protein [Candidatus Bathyarchaeota archaeon]
MEDYRKVLDLGLKYYEEGLALFRIHPWNACEKVWGGIWNSTRALLKRMGLAEEPPKGITWRSYLEEVFMKYGLGKDEARDMAGIFIDARKKLHGACFYGGLYEEGEDDVMARTICKKYILKICELLKRKP